MGTDREGDARDAGGVDEHHGDERRQQLRGYGEGLPVVDVVEGVLVRDRQVEEEDSHPHEDDDRAESHLTRRPPQESHAQRHDSDHGAAINERRAQPVDLRLGRVDAARVAGRDEYRCVPIELNELYNLRTRQRTAAENWRQSARDTRAEEDGGEGGVTSVRATDGQTQRTS